MKWLEKYLDKIKTKPRPFLAFQIEPTSRCQLHCVMCPRTTFSNEWESRDMPLSLYRKISEYFDHVENIHLQGWGEPLLNPDIFEMIRMAKVKRCSVSLTTNGDKVTPDISKRLMKEGLDIIAISIAGATKETHERIRCGSDFEQCIKNIQALSDLKAVTKSRTPKIILSFLMTKINYEELPDLVQLSKDMKVNELVATNLDYAPTEVQDELRLFSCSTTNGGLKKVVERAVKGARKNRVPFRVYPLEMENVVMCEMNPLRIIFLSHDGCVSPCVYLNMTKRGMIRRMFCGSSSEVQRVCFGNVGEHDLMDIWGKSDYQDFRRIYLTRLNVVENIYGDIGIDMVSIERLRKTGKIIEEELMKNPVPAVCKTCYKAYGI
jgi:MoaA/NifB/PqqE/SkfB family radical SAM enzyme